jgi:hypothetical protein
VIAREEAVRSTLKYQRTIPTVVFKGLRKIWKLSVGNTYLLQNRFSALHPIKTKNTSQSFSNWQQSLLEGPPDTLVSPHMKTEAEPASETLCFNYTWMMVQTQTSMFQNITNHRWSATELKFLSKPALETSPLECKPVAFTFWSLRLHKEGYHNTAQHVIRPSSGKAPFLLIIFIARALSSPPFKHPWFSSLFVLLLWKNPPFHYAIQVLVSLLPWMLPLIS